MLDELPEQPSGTDLERVVSVALNSNHWINRKDAAEILGRMQYRKELKQIAERDEHPFIREVATLWLTEYDGQMRKYRISKRDSR